MTKSQMRGFSKATIISFRKRFFWLSFLKNMLQMLENVMKANARLILHIFVGQNEDKDWS